MESSTRRGRTATRGVDRPAVACLRAVVLAPGGFVIGYLGGRLAGRAVSGCPLHGLCADATPILLSLSCAVLGLGIGNTLAVLRVRYWWEGVVVWAVGTLASLMLVALLGSLGPMTVPGLLLAAGWAMLAVALAVAALRRREPIVEGS